MMTPSESGGSGGTRLTLSKRYSAALRSDGEAASATGSVREPREHDQVGVQPDAPGCRHAGAPSRPGLRGCVAAAKRPKTARSR